MAEGCAGVADPLVVHYDHSLTYPFTFFNLSEAVQHTSNSPSQSARPSVSLRVPSSLRRLALCSRRLTNSALLPMACRSRLFPLPPSTRPLLPLGRRRRLLRLAPSTSSVSSVSTARSTSRMVSTRSGDIVCLWFLESCTSCIVVGLHSMHPFRKAFVACTCVLSSATSTTRKYYSFLFFLH